MLYKLLFLCLALPFVSCFAETKGPALTHFQLKEKIADLQKRIPSTYSKEKGALLVDLALAYYYDQDSEKAFSSFLEALDAAKSIKPSTITDKEKQLYEEALKIYLGHNNGSGAQESAQKILKEYGPIFKEHPDYYLLGFLTAAAYANLQLFDRFFEQFYPSYQRYPESHMAIRTKAILHIKLYEKARHEAQREEQRQAITALVLKAAEVYPQDSSLYKLRITFATDSEKPQVIKEVLETIIKKEIQVPRSDLIFYVTAAVETQQKEIAQQFMDKARTWYPYSRVMDTAQEMIRR